MVKPAIKKIEQVGTRGGYGKGFWTLLLCLAFATLCLIHIESSRARDQDRAQQIAHPVTVERLPSSEARKMGVESRNH